MLSKWIRITIKRCSYPLAPHRLINLAKPLLLSFLGASLTSILVPLQDAYGAQLTHWLFDPTTQWLTLNVTGGTSPQYFLLAQPPRIVIDLPDTQVSNVPEITTYSGMIQSVRVGQFQPELTRIVIEFNPDTSFAPGHITIQPGDTVTADPDSGNTIAETWYIRPLLVGQSEVSPPQKPQTPSVAAERTPNALPDDFATRNLPSLEPGAVEIPIESPDPLPTSIAEPTLQENSNAHQSSYDSFTTAAQTSEIEATDESIMPESNPIAPESNPMNIGSMEPENGVHNNNIDAVETENLTDEVPARLTTQVSNDTETNTIAAGVLEGVVNPTPQNITDADVDTDASLEKLPAPETAFQTPLTINESADRISSGPANNRDSNSLESSVVETADLSVSIIAFGQDFRPEASGQSTPATEQVPEKALTETIVRLRYPRNTSLQVTVDNSRQEVLVVTPAVRDRAGDIMIPDGSLVIGRIERTGNQLRFIPQALTMGDRTIPLEPTTVDLSGAEIEPNQLIEMPIDATELDLS
ncbi:MAG: AMIN domain-containing protein [Cyanobacteria bacterium P01_F01_bin.150]